MTSRPRLKAKVWPATPVGFSRGPIKWSWEVTEKIGTRPSKVIGCGTTCHGKKAAQAIVATVVASHSRQT